MLGKRPIDEQVAPVELEAVCADPLRAGIELQAVAAEALCLALQPVDQPRADAAAAFGFVGDEVIDVHVVPADQVVHQAVPGDSAALVAVEGGRSFCSFRATSSACRHTRSTLPEQIFSMSASV